MTSSDSPRRRRLPAEQRREEILETATALISRVGFNAATLDDFAQAAAISRPGLLHHFSSKEAILEAVLRRRDEQDVATSQQAHQGRLSAPLARRRLTALVERNLARPKLVQLYTMLSVESLAPEHPAHAYFLSRADQARAVFRTYLVGWHPDPDAGAIELVSYLDGLQLSWLRQQDIDFLAQWNRFADRFFLEGSTDS